jgi:alpha-beta hydrolase superfamily lysophospholipase
VPKRDVTFTTSDHLTLAGTFFGQGTTTIIFSNQTDTLAKDWDGIAQQFAAQGYSTLAYDYRGSGQSQGQYAPAALATDLRAAVAFARGQGARKVVLLGASLGGTVTANVAADAGIAAVIILSAPRQWIGLDVTDALLRSITAPKLFLNSEQDTFAQDTQAMYDAALPPKEIHLYPGAWHGIAILNPATGDDALPRINAFLAQYAPAK